MNDLSSKVNIESLRPSNSKIPQHAKFVKHSKHPIYGKFMEARIPLRRMCLGCYQPCRYLSHLQVCPTQAELAREATGTARTSSETNNYLQAPRTSPRHMVEDGG